MSAVACQIALAESSPFICFLISVESPAFKSFELISIVPNRLLLILQALFSLDCITLAQMYRPCSLLGQWSEVWNKGVQKPQSVAMGSRLGDQLEARDDLSKTQPSPDHGRNRLEADLSRVFQSGPSSG